MRSEELLLTSSTVDHVTLANGLNSSQTHKEQHVSRDHLLIAHHAQQEDQMTDTLVLTAQLVQSKIQTMFKHVIFQVALEHPISNSQLMVLHVEDVKHAHGQHKFQITLELLV
jgi:hypothetical protein